MSISVILTRPLESGEDFAKALTKDCPYKLSIMHAPLMGFELLNNAQSFTSPLNNYDALMFTSRYGVKAYFDILGAAQSVPACIYAVGQETAKALEAMPILSAVEIIIADGDIVSLMDVIKHHAGANSARILFPCARDLSPRTQPLIAQSGLTVDILPLYQMNEKEFSHDIVEIMGKGAPAIIPFFSSRSAEIFIRKAGLSSHSRLGAGITAIAFSSQVADVLSHALWRDILISEAPTREAMIKAICKACASIS